MHKVQHCFFNHGIRLFAENQHVHIHRIDHQFLFPSDRVNGPGVRIAGGANISCTILVCYEFIEVR